jgi:hypothetical protein
MTQMIEIKVNGKPRKVETKGFPSPLLHCVLDLGNVKLLGTVQGTEEIRIGEKMVITEDHPVDFHPSFPVPLPEHE